jgi:hypothetical protein
MSKLFFFSKCNPAHWDGPVALGAGVVEPWQEHQMASQRMEALLGLGTQTSALGVAEIPYAHPLPVSQKIICLNFGFGSQKIRNQKKRRQKS